MYFSRFQARTCLTLNKCFTPTMPTASCSRACDELRTSRLLQEDDSLMEPDVLGHSGPFSEPVREMPQETRDQMAYPDDVHRGLQAARAAATTR